MCEAAEACHIRDFRDIVFPIPAKKTGTVGINLQVMRLGDIGFACFSGELYSPTGKYMKEHAVLPNTLVVNHCWQRPEQINGYCADDWTLRNGGFGLRQASTTWHSMRWRRNKS